MLLGKIVNVYLMFDYLQNLFEEVTSQLNKITGKCAAKDRASRPDCQRVLYQI